MLDVVRKASCWVLGDPGSVQTGSQACHMFLYKSLLMKSSFGESLDSLREVAK